MATAAAVMSGSESVSTPSMSKITALIFGSSLMRAQTAGKKSLPQPLSRAEPARRSSMAGRRAPARARENKTERWIFGVLEWRPGGGCMTPLRQLPIRLRPTEVSCWRIGEIFVRALRHKPEAWNREWLKPK